MSFIIQYKVLSHFLFIIIIIILNIWRVMLEVCKEMLANPYKVSYSKKKCEVLADVSETYLDRILLKPGQLLLHLKAQIDVAEVLARAV